MNTPKIPDDNKNHDEAKEVSNEAHVPGTPPPLPPTTNPEAPLAENPDTKTLIDALLRRPMELVSRVGERGITLRLAAAAIGSILVFGLVIGCFAKQQQLWAAPVKLGMGLGIASLICFPSLYIFSTLAGGRGTPRDLATCLAGSMALAGLLLLGVAPAIWVFAESTDSLGFMGFLSITAWLVALAFALRLLGLLTKANGAVNRAPLAVWAVVFTLVTLQMTTTLRPILGHSEQFLTNEKKFFLQHWTETIALSLHDTGNAAASKTSEPKTAEPLAEK